MESNKPHFHHLKEIKDQIHPIYKKYLKGFTLVELLVVIVIIGVLGSIVVFLINPLELNRQARDTTRLSDLDSLRNIIQIASLEAATGSNVNLCGSQPAPCQFTSYPADSNSRKADGTGWLKINLSALLGTNITSLPVDPLNNSSYFYTYKSDGKTWELTAHAESQKYQSQAQNDGGTLATLFEVGTNLSLIQNNDTVITASATPTSPSAINVKVLLLIYNPVLKSQGNKKLTVYKNWRDPDSLTTALINDLNTVSGGRVNYTLGERIELDKFPVKSDGFSYTDSSYLNCVNSGGSLCHNPDLSDYKKMITDADACTKRNNNQIQELWIWGGPWFGYWESNLAGANAFWYNSSPTTGTTCQKLLPIMGFNYERGEEEMFEDVGHRLESTMVQVFGTWQANESTPWNQFALLDVDKPGRGGCGNAHLAVNAGSNSGYDRTNARTVKSRCEDFANYPDLKGEFKDTNCNTWGCSTLGYFKWLFGHLPKAEGQTAGKENNWWKYLADPQTYISGGNSSGTTTTTPTPTPFPGTFTLQNATLAPSQASFPFSFSGYSNSYIIDLSTQSNMAWDVYLTFGSGSASPVLVNNPTKWDKYSCGRTLYWKVYNSDRTISSPIGQATVGC